MTIDFTEFFVHFQVRDAHPDEAKYVKMFQNMDITSNFYYSYSYDMTNTVQYNLENPKYLSTQTKTQKIEPIFENQTPKPSHLGYLSKPNPKFMWNEYLLSPVLQNRVNSIHHDWILPIIHGFVDQANISVYGSALLLTLIGRRSNKFAGQ